MPLPVRSAVPVAPEAYAAICSKDCDCSRQLRKPGLRMAWDVPYGSLEIGLDPLSAFFLLPLFGLGGLATVYGREY